MGEWANPDDFTAVFRLTSTKHAHEFIDDGIIKFNTPQSWVDCYEKHGNGRGDVYEGTLAFCGMFDPTRVIELNNEYNSSVVLNAKSRPIVTQFVGQRILFKDRRSLQLPCFCIYIMKNSLFPCPDSSGKHRLSAKIPASYFRDFSDNLLPEDVKKLPPEKQPALILISDFQKFKKRLYKALISIGIKDTEIVLGRVSYYDFEKYGPDGWIDLNQKYPMELLLKSNRFKDQSEARIIVNTRNGDAVNYLENNVLRLGCMRDIAQINESYLYEGADVEMTANTYRR